MKCIYFRHKHVTAHINIIVLRNIESVCVRIFALNGIKTKAKKIHYQKIHIIMHIAVLIRFPFKCVCVCRILDSFSTSKINARVSSNAGYVIHVLYILFKVHSIAIIWIAMVLILTDVSIQFYRTVFIFPGILMFILRFVLIWWNRWVRDRFQSILYHIRLFTHFLLWLYLKCNYVSRWRANKQQNANSKQ